MPFAFEDLDVYKKSLELVGHFEKLSFRLKGSVSYSYLDQFARATLSIPLNIAEGNGRWHIKEKKNFFWIARGSVFETVALIQVFHQGGHINRQDYDAYYDVLQTISKMLSGLIQSVDLIRR